MNSPMDGLKIKGVICDLDGSLLDSMWVWDEVDRVFLERRGFEVPKDYAVTIAPMGFDKAAVYTIERFGLCELKKDILKEWFDLAHQFFKEKVSLKKGGYEWLEHLKKLGIKICVATSSDPYLYEDSLESLGIQEFFEFCLDPSWEGFDKTKPIVYQECANRLGLLPEECLVLEDIPSALKSAKEAGCKTIGVIDKNIYGKEVLEPFSDILVENLAEEMLYGKEMFE